MKFLYYSILIFGMQNLYAQTKVDSSLNNLNNAFKKGKANGNSRFFRMNTHNASGLTDYTALAWGMGINYKSAQFHHFNIEMGANYIFNLSGNNYNKIDSATQLASRFEIGLFDVANPSNNNLVRLENLNLAYNFNKTLIKYGQFVPNTSFLNTQDGRMTLTMVRGLQIKSQAFRNLDLEFMLINKISPRSTVNWYSIGQSMSLYPVGRAENGKKSNFANYISPNYLGYFSANFKPQKSINLKIENYYLQSIFNLAMIRTEYQNKNWFIGAMFGYQNPFKNDLPVDQKYINHSSNFVSGRLESRAKNLIANLNYTHISSSGRLLFPREWGRDPFYTFMPREKNEGNGGVNAYTLGLTYFAKNKISFNGIYGLNYLADMNNAVLNKYSMPAYSQLNLSLKQSLSKYFHGFSYEILFISKKPIGNEHLEPKFVFNKVNMSQLNLILNFNF